MCKVKEFVFIYLLISVFCGCSHKNDIQFQRDFSSFLNVPLSTEGFNYLINNSTNHGLEKIQVIYGSKIQSSVSAFRERIQLSFRVYEIHYSGCRSHIFSQKGDTLIFLKINNRWLYDDIKLNYSFYP